MAEILHCFALCWRCIFTAREKQLTSKLNSEGLTFLIGNIWPVVNAIEILSAAWDFAMCLPYLSHSELADKNLSQNFWRKSLFSCYQHETLRKRVNDLLVSQRICFVVISLACWRMKSRAYATWFSRLTYGFLENRCT